MTAAVIFASLVGTQPLWASDNPLDVCLASSEVQDPAARAEHVTKHCISLFEQPTCRDAWHTVSIENRHQEAVALACTTAYCPQLEEPQPTLCHRAPGDSIDPSDWSAFLLEALRHDLEVTPGTEQDEKLKTLVDQFESVEVTVIEGLSLPTP